VWRLWYARPQLTLDQIREMTLDDVDLQILFLERVDAAQAEARASAAPEA
jgi:hypothetical protein